MTDLPTRTTMPAFGRISFAAGLAVVLLWPRYLFVTVAGKGVSGYTLVSLALPALAIFLLLMDPRRRAAFTSGLARSLPLLLLVAAYFSWRAFADVVGESPDASLASTVQDVLYIGGWAITAAVFCFDGRILRDIPILFVFCIVVATAIGLYEYRSHTRFIDFSGLVSIVTINPVSLAAIRAGSSGVNFWRASSVFSHPIVYGQTIGLLAPAALHLLLRGRGLAKFCGAAALPCVAISLVICKSRSPQLVAALVLLIYLITLYLDFRHRGRMLVLVGLIVAVAVASPVAYNWTSDLASGSSGREADSTAVRRVQVANARDALIDSPVTGFGSGQAPLRAGVRGRYHVLSIDSYYLTVAVESGLVGLGLFAALLTAAFLQGAAMAVRERDGDRRSVLAMFCAIVVGVGLGISVLSIADELTLVFLAIGVFVAARGRAAAPADVRPRFGAARQPA